MKVVIERSLKSSVLIDNKEERSINKGLVVLLGITNNDKLKDINYLVKKITNLRIFEDKNNKMNYSVKDINGDILVISQFTLYANTKKGNRPSFENSLKFEEAKKLYDTFIKKLKEEYGNVLTGEFGSDMKVSTINDGPVTIIIDTKENCNEKE